MAGPLKGLKVLDFTTLLPGPFATMMLADMGAEVVKIEPFIGDQFREPMEGANFFNFNRNKRAMALNLKTPEGKEIVLKLAKNSDVLVENFLPGSMDKLGLGYEAISRIQPGIIYCSISGFGQEGPFSNNIIPAIQKTVNDLKSQVGHADAIIIGVDKGNGYPAAPIFSHSPSFPINPGAGKGDHLSCILASQSVSLGP